MPQDPHEATLRETERICAKYARYVPPAMLVQDLSSLVAVAVGEFTKYLSQTAETIKAEDSNPDVSSNVGL